MKQILNPNIPIAILIPCYNCGAAVIEVVGQCRQYSERILTINDGSTDNTAEFLKKCQTESIGWNHNRGKGAALRDGFVHLLQQGNWSAVITIDSDGQHDPSDISSLTQLFEQSGADIVVGWRNFETPDIPPIRRYSNIYSSKIIAAITGCDLRDLQCGYRLFSRSALERLLPLMHSDRYAVETEMILTAHKLGMKIEETPVRCIYTEESSQRSSWKPFIDSWYIAKVVARHIHI
jgi:glycosyltransferase involved in cell wall biosynthesis